MERDRTVKPVRWIASSRKDLKAFPDAVRQDIGIKLFAIQTGDDPPGIKALKNFGGAGVLEIVEDYDSDTYRAVYTVKFKGVIYVLHCFQKKSKKGIATPKPDMDLIRNRLKVAEEDFEKRKENVHGPSQ